MGLPRARPRRPLRGDQPLARRGGPLRRAQARSGALRLWPDGDPDRHAADDARPGPDRRAGQREPRPGVGRRGADRLVARRCPGCQWTASVCTGAGLYAAAGLLEGKKTTTHWGFRDNIRAMGVEVVADRVVWQGTRGAGVCAGIDTRLSPPRRAAPDPQRRRVPPRRDPSSSDLRRTSARGAQAAVGSRSGFQENAENVDR